MAKDVVHGGAFFDAIGVDLQTLARKDEVISADVLDAWYDPSPRVIAAIQQHLPWLIKTSPPTHAEGLTKIIGQSRAIAPECILPGTGTSSLMYAALPRLCPPGGTALLLDPTYGEYAHVLEVAHAERIQVQRHQLPTSDFRPDLGSLAEQASQADLLLLVNPNSPTGTGLTLDEISRLIKSIPNTTRVWIDETYIDFLPGKQSAECLIEAHPNLVIAKSLSKFYALSGLRIGYLAAHPQFIWELEPYTPPWSVGLIAQLAAIEALLDTDYYQARAAETMELRNELQGSLRELPGLHVYASDTNFFMVRLESSAQQLCEQLAEEHIFIRNCDSLSPRFQDNFVRIAVKSSSENRRVSEALTRFLGL